MQGIFKTYDLAGLKVKNRMVVPPMVCFGYSTEAGKVTEANIKHYEAFARGDAGVIIVEASCVLEAGRLSLDQLGLWSDDQIEGMSMLAKGIKEQSGVALVQLHHAGEKRHKTLGDYSVNNLTKEEIEQTICAYVEAAKRAEKAGFDGVELHGAHGYLLCQMASGQVNQRTDEYGNTLDGRLFMAKKIIEGIKASCPKLSIMGYRMGADEPDLATGIEIGKKLESYGVNLLHVSTGMGGEAKPKVPEAFPENWIVFMGTQVKKAVSIPVIVVNGIREAQNADQLIESDMADFIALGRPHLVDSSWTKKVAEGTSPIACINCKPCRWFKDGRHCPKRIENISND